MFNALLSLDFSWYVLLLRTLCSCSFLGIADIASSSFLHVTVICSILILQICVSSLREGMIFVYDCTSGLCEGACFVYPPGIVLGVRRVCFILVMFVPYDGTNCLFVSILFSISTHVGLLLASYRYIDRAVAGWVPV